MLTEAIEAKNSDDRTQGWKLASNGLSCGQGYQIAVDNIPPHLNPVPCRGSSVRVARWRHPDTNWNLKQADASGQCWTNETGWKETEKPPRAAVNQKNIQNAKSLKSETKSWQSPKMDMPGKGWNSSTLRRDRWVENKDKREAEKWLRKQHKSNHKWDREAEKANFKSGLSDLSTVMRVVHEADNSNKETSQREVSKLKREIEEEADPKNSMKNAEI